MSNSRHKVKSAYFPEDDSTVVHESCVATEINSFVMTPGDVEPKIPIPKFEYNISMPPTVFPNQRTVLWNRSNFGSPVLLSPDNVIPVLRITPACTSSIMKQLCTSEQHESGQYGSMPVMLCNLMSVSELDREEAHCLKNRQVSSVQPERFVFSLNTTELQNSALNQDKKGDILQVPLSVRGTHDQDMLFDENSTKNLLSNFNKGLSRGKSFSLRSCLRLRAAARLHSHDNNNGMRLIAPMRLEVIAPSFYFEAVQIGSIPVFTTAATSIFLEDQTHPNMGYITLNQTRKLVLIPSSSELASVNCEVITAPVVGVWVSMPNMDCPADFISNVDNLNNNESPFCPLEVLQNPYVWGVCVKYMLTEQLQDKVWVSPSTFLLTLFAKFGVFHFEIKHLQNAKSHYRQLTKDNLSFYCQEYVVKLECTKIFKSGGSSSSFVTPLKSSQFVALRSVIAPSYSNIFSNMCLRDRKYTSVSSEQESRHTLLPHGTNETQFDSSQFDHSSQVDNISYSEYPTSSLSEEETRRNYTSQSGSSDYVHADNNISRDRNDFSNYPSTLTREMTEKDGTRTFANTSNEQLVTLSVESYLAQQRELEFLKGEVSRLQQLLSKNTINDNHCVRNNSDAPRDLIESEKSFDDPQGFECPVSDTVDIKFANELPTQEISPTTENNLDENADLGEMNTCPGDCKGNDSDSIMSLGFTPVNFCRLEAPSLFDIDQFTQSVNSKVNPTTTGLSAVTGHHNTGQTKSALDAFLPQGTSMLSSNSSQSTMPFTEASTMEIRMDMSNNDVDHSPKMYNDDETESMLLIESKYL